MRMVSEDHVASLEPLGPAPGPEVLVQPLPAVDQTELWRTMETVGAAYEAAAARLAAGVSAKAEALFSRLERTYVGGRGWGGAGERQMAGT